jgi:hypothetical protein
MARNIELHAVIARPGTHGLHAASKGTEHPQNETKVVRRRSPDLYARSPASLRQLEDYIVVAFSSLSSVYAGQ